MSIVVELEASMTSVQIEQKSLRCPSEGSSIAISTVAEVERSARYYEKVFGARILPRVTATPLRTGSLEYRDNLNVGGGPTSDKATVGNDQASRPESLNNF